MEGNANQPVQDPDLQPKPPQYHPRFCDVIKEADKAVTLMSGDNVKFLVNSTILRASSDFFQTLLSLPQPEGSEAVIPCPDEDSTTIESILRIVTWKEFPNLSTIKEIKSIVLIAEKWEMRGVLSVLRMLLLRDLSFASRTPLYLYWLGCRMEWDDVWKLASKHSCHKDVYTGPTLHPCLSPLDPVDLWRLMWFHEKRRTEIVTQWIASESRFGQTTHCSKYLGCVAEKCLIRASLVHLTDNHPPSHQPTRANIEQSVNVVANGKICQGCRDQTVKMMSANIPALWANLPQTA